MHYALFFMIEIVNVTKLYYELAALDNISLTIPRGEVVGLLGPNGAGKTTLMKVIAGLLKPNRGQIRPLQQRWPSIGYKPERLLYPNHLRVKEYLRLIAGLSNLTGSQAETAVAHSLQQVQLTPHAHKKIGHCSKGMRQRIGLAQVLIGNPSLLLLDEPSNGLDPDGQQEILEIIRTIQASGRTIIISSHQLQEVTNICTYLIILNEGRVLYQSHMADALAIRPHTVIHTDKDLAPMRDLLLRVTPHLTIEGHKLILEEGAMSLRRQLMVILLNSNYDIVRVDQKRTTLAELYKKVVV
jgi:ABC-2 type transport system ATP-binding protein